jgi:hypothetical protein
MKKPFITLALIAPSTCGPAAAPSDAQPDQPGKATSEADVFASSFVFSVEGMRTINGAL